MPLIPNFKRRPKTNIDQLHREFIRREAQIGGELFGAIEPDRRRDFFCLDEYTWIWFESWRDGRGKEHTTTVRYEVRPDGILKAQAGRPYQQVEGQEAKNFIEAVRLYNKRVIMELYLPTNLQSAV